MGNKGGVLGLDEENRKIGEGKECRGCRWLVYEGVYGVIQAKEVGKAVLEARKI